MKSQTMRSRSSTLTVTGRAVKRHSPAQIEPPRHHRGTVTALPQSELPPGIPEGNSAINQPTRTQVLHSAHGVRRWGRQDASTVNTHIPPTRIFPNPVNQNIEVSFGTYVDQAKEKKLKKQPVTTGSLPSRAGGGRKYTHFRA